MRKVMQPGGIVNDAEGWSAPQGAYIGLDIHSVQHDPDLYTNPNEYDAFSLLETERGVGEIERRGEG